MNALYRLVLAIIALAMIAGLTIHYMDEIPSGISSYIHDETEFKAIMPRLGNETLKAELGRASWKHFHTMLGRFPEKPTKSQRTKLNTYIHLFAELYPCGECSEHAIELLKRYPPQTSSRTAAAMWGCHLHNKVNENLGHDLFDCTTVLEHYDCGCAE